MGLSRNQYFEVRNEFVQMLQNELIGPMGGAAEIIDERPDKRYLMGMVFPKGADVRAVKGGEEADGASPADSKDSPIEYPTDLLFQKLPASVGISFACRHQKHIVIDVWVSGAHYVKEDSPQAHNLKRNWRRISLCNEESEKHTLVIGERSDHKNILRGKAKLHYNTKRHDDVTVVTLTIVNTAQTKDNTILDVEDVLFQVKIEAKPVDGIVSYPNHKRLSPDEEDQELALQYSKRPTFGIGHGCSVDWNPAYEGKTDSIWSEFLPRAIAPDVTTEINELGSDAKKALSIQFLQSDSISSDELTSSLFNFHSSYKEWAAKLHDTNVPEEFVGSKNRIISRISIAESRIARGIRLLKTSGEARKAFRLANRAMLLQMVNNSKINNSKDKDSVKFVTPDLNSKEHIEYAWRPFQLAFILLSLNGIWDENDPDRELVDLIWFPTGGGKTEAYLAVAALEIIRRRMQYKESGAGTAIIMRYTLRLLTADQFQRAAGFICALELLRRNHSNLLGEIPISLGLWAGEAASPNQCQDSLEIYNRLVEQEGQVDNPFQLQRCPVCGCSIVPATKDQGKDRLGIKATASSFEFFCPADDCCFNDFLPIQIIDECLYEDPCTLVIGTIDKFAMLTWRDKARSFFGKEKGYIPPSLIIQDELHLITGPLGTIAGVYEAGIDTAIRALEGNAKIICSTATIRRAQDQIQQLYARKASVFPPPGIDVEDSFFSRTDSRKPGRMYVGAMGQGHTPIYSTVIAASSMLAIPAEMITMYGEEIDPWWTLVMFHNSRRELGKTLTLARDDIPSRIQALYSNESSGHPLRTIKEVQELSANLQGHQIPSVLANLEKGYGAEAIDILACTNMLSVGVDIKRLGLMLVLGQPKTTAEYIQATSRVGRDTKDRLPGLILTLYSPTKPRDRSHYEVFKGYHESLYRCVEPTSVTPFALPSRDRALHASFLALVRMVSDVYKNEDAGLITELEEPVRILLEQLSMRMAAADPQEEKNIRKELKAFLADWIEKANDTTQELRIQAAWNSRNFNALIKPFHSYSDGKETLQSMRYVDINAAIRIRRN